MRFEPTILPGVFVIRAEPAKDERGSFTRIYCPFEFAAAGIVFDSTQINLSQNRRKHTLRGMHHQVAPHAEAKLVRVVRGQIYDVAVDIRPDSPTFGRWIGVTLDSGTMSALFLPEGIAHGFITLEDETDVLYQMGRPFEPGLGRGFRYDDPAFAIEWPFEPAVVSDRDLAYPPFAL